MSSAERGNAEQRVTPSVDDPAEQCDNRTGNSLSCSEATFISSRNARWKNCS
jgi:hypothetical protein